MESVYNVFKSWRIIETADQFLMEQVEQVEQVREGRRLDYITL